MVVLGIGVLIFSIAFAVLVGYLSYTLYAMTKVIDGVGDTVEQLPDQLDTIFKETENILHESNQTLTDLNEKMRTLSPLFYAVEDVTEATRGFASSLASNPIFKRKQASGEDAGESEKSAFRSRLFKRRKK
ncbi:DUF948 domain-containing protein [Virgibacillus alimentarius]|uniref:Uncharacterized protein YoxC n=1 Tax=Virgibacillus alimentarius TaxID=698769 RepID=A0ABS4S891_9BACI|nr:MULTISPECIES: DUF948 domain-containing protein [Virgibacillus]MBP2257708.1 uncharacterized protein YoxC [Virgibacillus alimentarius]HLR69298.1 DUF948 domain-containing protein [Virgibacillus sp.]